MKIKLPEMVHHINKKTHTHTITEVKPSSVQETSHIDITTRVGADLGVDV